MWRRFFGWEQRPDRYAEISEGNELSHQLVVLRPLDDANIDIVFIHELTECGDEAWGGKDPGSCWPVELPTGDFDHARIISFSYSYNNLKTLGDLIDPAKLRECAEALMRDFPLRVASTPSIAGAPGSGSNEFPVDISRPVIFVAHGFGGLIYEQALTMSYEADITPSRSRLHAVMLLDTPHHGAGMADWAVICAQRLGIPCASTPQKQKWSPLTSQLGDIERMQREFRRIIRQKIKIDIYGCFATKPMLDSYSGIAPEWTVLPDFHVVGIEQNHFVMTRIVNRSPDFYRICTTMREETKNLIGKNVSRKAYWEPTTAEEAPEDHKATDTHSNIIPAQISEIRSLHPVGETQHTSKRLALLIASPFGDLRGPLNDVASMEAILKGQGFSIDQCYGQNATREKILEAWNSLIGSISSPGVTVVIYYSGHGGIVQDWADRGSDAEDDPRRYQYLVPMDLEKTPLIDGCTYSDGPFLGILDIEIAHLLYKTTQRTPNVTVIFDCSYSKHGTHDPTHPETAMVRNMPELFHDKFSNYVKYVKSTLEYPEESVLQLKSNENVVFIEAAATGETAWDELFNGKPMGALTKALVPVLQAVGENTNGAVVSWQTIMQRVRYLVNVDFPRQNPRVAGPADRILFSTEVTKTDALPLRISKVNESNNMGLMNVGTASGVRENNVYVLMPPGEESVDETKQLGTAEITYASDIYSNARLSLKEKNQNQSILREGVLGFLVEEAPVKWSVSVPYDIPGLLEDVTKSRYLRSRNVTQKERFLATFHRHEDTIILINMQGVPVAQRQVPDNDSESWAKARHSIVKDAEQLARSHHFRTFFCDNRDEQLDHELDITIEFAQDMQGSVFEGTSFSISLLNRGAKRLCVYIFCINVTGEIYELSKTYHMTGYKKLSEMDVSWTKDVPKTKPITEHLFFIITDVQVDLSRLEALSPEDESDWSDLSPYDQLSEALRKAAPKHSSKVRYDTRHFTFNITPSELPVYPNLAKTGIIKL